MRLARVLVRLPQQPTNQAARDHGGGRGGGGGGGLSGEPFGLY